MSAPAADLAPIHQYRIEDKRKPRSKEGSVAGSLGTSLKASSLMASSLVANMNSLQLDETIEEGEEPGTPESECGVVLKTLQEKLGITPANDDAEESAVSEADDDDELQFELS